MVFTDEVPQSNAKFRPKPCPCGAKVMLQTGARSAPALVHGFLLSLGLEFVL